MKMPIHLLLKIPRLTDIRLSAVGTATLTETIDLETRKGYLSQVPPPEIRLYVDIDLSYEDAQELVDELARRGIYTSKKEDYGQAETDRTSIQTNDDPIRDVRSLHEET